MNLQSEIIKGWKLGGKKELMKSSNHKNKNWEIGTQKHQNRNSLKKQKRETKTKKNKFGKQEVKS